MKFVRICQQIFLIEKEEGSDAPEIVLSAQGDSQDFRVDLCGLKGGGGDLVNVSSLCRSVPASGAALATKAE